MLERQGEEVRVHPGQDEPSHSVADGPHEAVQSEPLVAALPQLQRPLAAPHERFLGLMRCQFGS